MTHCHVLYPVSVWQSLQDIMSLRRCQYVCLCKSCHLFLRTQLDIMEEAHSKNLDFFSFHFKYIFDTFICNVNKQNYVAVDSLCQSNSRWVLGLSQKIIYSNMYWESKKKKKYSTWNENIVIQINIQLFYWESVREASRQWSVNPVIQSVIQSPTVCQKQFLGERSGQRLPNPPSNAWMTAFTESK